MLLTEQQIQLLKDFGFDWNHNDTRNLRRERRYKRKYGVTSSVTWSADYEILKLLFIAMSEQNKPTKQITKQLHDYFDNSKAVWDDIFKLSPEKQIWFAEKTQIILQLYKNMAPRFIDMHYHKYEINLPNNISENHQTYFLNGLVPFKYHTQNNFLEGDQMFFLNWLLERLKIFNKTKNREDFEKFALVWIEVASDFWW